MENDELDEKSDELEVNYETAADAYCLPCLQPPDFLLASVSTSTQQLVNSTWLQDLPTLVDTLVECDLEKILWETRSEFRSVYEQERVTSASNKVGSLVGS